MSEFRKASSDKLYFITLTVVGWIDIFTRNEYKNIIVQNLKYCQENENLEIYSYVIMTNHIHLICRRVDNDLQKLLGRFKSYTAKEIIKAIENNPTESRKDWLLYLFKFYAKQNGVFDKNHFWQSANYPIELYSYEVIKQKENYIHLNPVRAGIVANEGGYLFSSASKNSPLKVLNF